MIEKVTLQLTDTANFLPADGSRCETMNPKALLLYAAAKCAGLTALHILEKQRVRPKRLEIGVSGELSTDTVQSESLFRSFRFYYNVECASDDDQAKVSQAIRLTHDKHCSMVQMLGRIAPVTHEVAIVSTEPERV